MNQLRVALRLRVLASLARDVPLDQVRHDDRPVYRFEGYGGGPIACFPPFRFYRLFHDGRRDEAFETFSAWYVDQFRKYASVPKKLGGMQNGSFHRLLLSISGGDSGAVLALGSPSEDLLRRAAMLRVEQRMALFEGIRDLGYQVVRAKPVLGVRRDRNVYLTGGHHRAAALTVLGQQAFPRVSVFPPRALRTLKSLRIV
jgi:hypothetical protein